MPCNESELTVEASGQFRKTRELLEENHKNIFPISFGDLILLFYLVPLHTEDGESRDMRHIFVSILFCCFDNMIFFFLSLSLIIQNFNRERLSKLSSRQNGSTRAVLDGFQIKRSAAASGRSEYDFVRILDVE